MAQRLQDAAASQLRPDQRNQAPTDPSNQNPRQSSLLRTGIGNPFAETAGTLAQRLPLFGAANTIPRKDSISPPPTLDILEQLKLDGGKAIEK